MPLVPDTVRIPLCDKDGRQLDIKFVEGTNFSRENLREYLEVEDVDGVRGVRGRSGRWNHNPSLPWQNSVPVTDKHLQLLPPIAQEIQSRFLELFNSVFWACEPQMEA